MTTTTAETTPRVRTVLITGTSSGIGLATALASARAGWNTVATMRDLSRAGALRAAADDAGLQLDVRRLDVTNESAVRQEVDACANRYGQLDAVVNNAGSASVGTVETMSVADFRSAMEVNFFGVVHVTRAALPHLRASRGRVITISSVGGIVGQPFNEAYCAAKFAVEGFLESLYPVAQSVGVGVHVIEPGAVASEFVANAGVDPAVMIEQAGAYASVLTSYLQRTMQQFSSAQAQSPDDVGRIVAATLEGQRPFRQQTSSGTAEFVATKLSDPDGSRVTSLTADWLGG